MTLPLEEIHNNLVRARNDLSDAIELAREYLGGLDMAIAALLPDTNAPAEDEPTDGINAVSRSCHSRNVPRVRKYPKLLANLVIDAMIDAPRRKYTAEEIAQLVVGQPGVEECHVPSISPTMTYLRRAGLVTMYKIKGTRVHRWEVNVETTMKHRKAILSGAYLENLARKAS